MSDFESKSIIIKCQIYGMLDPRDDFRCIVRPKRDARSQHAQYVILLSRGDF